MGVSLTIIAPKCPFIKRVGIRALLMILIVHRYMMVHSMILNVSRKY